MNRHALSSRLSTLPERFLAATAFACVMALTACGGSSIDDVGEMGNLQYTLSSDHLLEATSLTAVPIVAGHPQLIYTQPLEDGVDTADITHKLDVEGSESSTGSYALVEAPSAGTFDLESFRAGELYDYIPLTFAELGAFEMLAQVRQPKEEAFTLYRDAEGEPEEPIAVGEGTLVAFLPVPMDEAGERLAGNIELELTVEPEWAVIDNVGMVFVYEDYVGAVSSSDSYYIIEPGLVTFTLTDERTGLSRSRTFDVSPVHPE